MLHLRFKYVPGDYVPFIEQLQIFHPITQKSLMNNVEGLRIFGTSCARSMHIIGVCQTCVYKLFIYRGT